MTDWLDRLSFPASFGEPTEKPADRLDEEDDAQMRLTDYFNPD